MEANEIKTNEIKVKTEEKKRAQQYARYCRLARVELDAVSLAKKRKARMWGWFGIFIVLIIILFLIVIGYAHTFHYSAMHMIVYWGQWTFICSGVYWLLACIGYYRIEPDFVSDATIYDRADYLIRGELIKLNYAAKESASINEKINDLPIFEEEKS